MARHGRPNKPTSHRPFQKDPKFWVFFVNEFGPRLDHRWTKLNGATRAVTDASAELIPPSPPPAYRRALSVSLRPRSRCLRASHVLSNVLRVCPYRELHQTANARRYAVAAAYRTAVPLGYASLQGRGGKTKRGEEKRTSDPTTIWRVGRIQHLAQSQNPPILTQVPAECRKPCRADRPS